MRILPNHIKIIQGSRACGISIWITEDDLLIINSIFVERKGNEISFSNPSSFTSLDDLKSNIPKNIPIYLSVDGKGIIHKTFEKDLQMPLIEYIFPNTTSRDFILQETLLTENKRIISVVREEKLSELLLKINEKGFFILKILIGPYSIINLLQDASNDTIIHLPFYDINIKAGQFIGYERIKSEFPSFTLKLDTGEINSRFIVPFSNSLFHFKESDNISIDCPWLQSQHENYKFKRLFQLSGWGILIFLFISLLINYLLFDNYRNKNKLLSSQIGTNKEILIRIEKLTTQIKEKEEFYQSNLTFNNHIYSYYFDRIAKDIPLNITLSRFCISPVVISQKGEESLSFQKDKIIISGHTTTSSYLDSWIKSLRSLSWINEISIKNYADNGIELASFDLEISLSEESK